MMGVQKRIGPITAQVLATDILSKLADAAAYLTTVSTRTGADADRDQGELRHLGSLVTRAYNLIRDADQAIGSIEDAAGRAARRAAEEAAAREVRPDVRDVFRDAQRRR